MVFDIRPRGGCVWCENIAQCLNDQFGKEPFLSLQVTISMTLHTGVRSGRSTSMVFNIHPRGGCLRCENIAECFNEQFGKEPLLSLQVTVNMALHSGVRYRSKYWNTSAICLVKYSLCWHSCCRHWLRNIPPRIFTGELVGLGSHIGLV